MRRITSSIVVYLLLTFVSGAALGALGHWLYDSRKPPPRQSGRNPEEYRRRYMEEMNTRLKLSEAQAAQLSEILDRTRARFKEHFAKVKPEMDAIQKMQVDEVNSILDETQRAEYAQMQKERGERQKRSPRLPAGP